MHTRIIFKKSMGNNNCKVQANLLVLKTTCKVNVFILKTTRKSILFRCILLQSYYIMLTSKDA